ncbi:MAG: hypothetical protein JWQ75_4256 [Pseudarthrobacter sp.]|nr:hypothetical protein [Pseudarthrobacter sp.]
MTAAAANTRDALAQRLRDILASHQNVREVRMFGGLSFMVDERMAVAARRDGDLLVRTDPAAYDDLLRRGGEPAYMGDDRPMGRGWLTVPHGRIQDNAALAYWVKVGIDSRNVSG